MIGQPGYEVRGANAGWVAESAIQRFIVAKGTNLMLMMISERGEAVVAPPELSIYSK